MTNEWIKKIMVYRHDGLLFGHEKDRNNGICSNMDGPRNYHDSETPTSYAVAYMWNLKMYTINFFAEQKLIHGL